MYLFHVTLTKEKKRQTHTSYGQTFIGMCRVYDDEVCGSVTMEYFFFFLRGKYRREYCTSMNMMDKSNQCSTCWASFSFALLYSLFFWQWYFRLFSLKKKKKKRYLPVENTCWDDCRFFLNLSSIYTPLSRPRVLKKYFFPFKKVFFFSCGGKTLRAICKRI